MPVTTPEQKILKTRMFGGSSSNSASWDYFDKSLEAAQRFVLKGRLFSFPFDGGDVVEGRRRSRSRSSNNWVGAVPDRRSSCLLAAADSLPECGAISESSAAIPS
jgi:threonine dehydratase